MRFPLVFVVARCLVFDPSSALHLIVVFGIVSVVRVRCTLVVLVHVSLRAFSRFFVTARAVRVAPSFVVIRWLLFERCARISYRAVRKIKIVYVICCVHSFVLVCSFVTARSAVSSFVVFLRVSVCVRTFRYRFCL